MRLSLSHVPTLCNPMDCSTPGFPVPHYLWEFAQTHVHWVSDAIQPSHPLSPTSRPAFNLPHYQGLFQWVGFSHQVAKLLELQLQHQSSMNSQGWFPLGLTGLIFLLSKGLSRVFFRTTIWKYQFFGTQPSLWSNSHICTWLLRKLELWLHRPFLAKWCLCFLICCLGFVIAFLPRIKQLLIVWLPSPSTMILEPRKIKSVTAPTFSPSICHEVMGPDAMILVFWMLSFKPPFSFSSFTFIKRLFNISSLSAIRVVSSG